MKRGPVFEVKRNRAGLWFWHELAGGQIVDHSQAYKGRSSKSNAKRAAKRKADTTLNASYRVVSG